MSLDHLVYAVPDLDQAVRRLAELTGVQPVEGGRHIALGTRNYLLGLGDAAYLECIGPDQEQPGPARPRPFGIDDLTEPRLVAWAMRVREIDAHVARARELGYDPGPIGSMSRRTPTGELLSWRLTYEYDAVLPFLIDWGTTPHPAHELPVVPLTAFYARHPEPAEPLRRLAAIGAELDVRRGEPGLTAIIGDTVLA
jgi:hypothetical protein